LPFASLNIGLYNVLLTKSPSLPLKEFNLRSLIIGTNFTLSLLFLINKSTKFYLSTGYSFSNTSKYPSNS